MNGLIGLLSRFEALATIVFVRAFLVAVPIALTLVLSPTAAATPRTLLSTPHDLMAASQDDGRVAYVLAVQRGWVCRTVWISRIGSDRRVRLRRFCEEYGPWNLAARRYGSFHLAGRRAVWPEGEWESVEYASWKYRTAALDDRRVRYLRLGGSLSGGDGESGATFAHEGPHFVYGWFVKGLEGDPEEEGCCRPFVAGGVTRIVGGREVDIPGMPPVADIAVDGDRMALVSRPESGAPAVEIRSIETGALLQTFAVAGTPHEVAMDAGTAAVRYAPADGDAAQRIARFDATTGAPLGDLDVSGRARELDMAARRVVWIERGIRLLDAATGATQVLARSRTQLHSLSIDGRRVMWVSTRPRGVDRLQYVVVRP